MDYVLPHWGFLHYDPVAFDAFIDAEARRRCCLWLLKNTESFDQWVLALWILDRFPNDYTLLTRVCVACISRKYHALEYRACHNRNKVLLNSIESGISFGLKDVMKMEKRIMNRVGWSLPSFQISLCMKAIESHFSVGGRRALKTCVTSWCLMQPVRSCAWVCIVPTFACLKLSRRDDTPWLRWLAKMKVSHSPLWLPVGDFIALARDLSVRVRTDDYGDCSTSR